MFLLSGLSMVRLVHFVKDLLEHEEEKKKRMKGQNLKNKSESQAGNQEECKFT